MKAIIVGVNRAEIGKVKLKTWQLKRWYLTGADLYKMSPEDFQRIISTKYGHPIRDDEGLIYPEGALAPYHPKHALYSANKIVSEIRQHKQMISDKKVRWTELVGKHSRDLRELRKSWPMLLVGFIVLWAVVF